MTRDEVIRGLEICLSNEHCEEDCPWRDKCWDGDAWPTRPLIAIAYAMIKDLLKEQPKEAT